MFVDHFKCKNCEHEFLLLNNNLIDVGCVKCGWLDLELVEVYFVEKNQDFARSDKLPSMRGLAFHIISVAYKNNIPIVNMQVQKIMFMLFGIDIYNNGNFSEIMKNTYDTPFEKWEYGAVVPSIFYKLNNFKDNQITLTGAYDYTYSNWDETIIKLLKTNVFDLVKLIVNLPSYINCNSTDREEYTLEEIKNDFISDFINKV